MSIIGETILTVSIEMLVEKLVSEVINLFARQEKIQASLKEWNKKLLVIKAVLDDADEQQTTKQSVKNWLGELQNLAYDVEDLLDEFATKALRRKLLSEPADPDQPSTSKLQFHKLIPNCCTKFSPENVKFESKMESEIEIITARLGDIVDQKNLLGLKESPEGKPKKLSQRPESTCLVIEAEVQGREAEKEAIVKLLLQDDSTIADGIFSVIPITGMGGLGKTTLAQLVYNDDTVGSKFDTKAWACVSEDYDAVRVTKAILKSIGVETAADDNLNSLQVKLRDGLTGNKFLIVLDDMWNQSYGDWADLRRPFAAGAQGSKIIVTTRNQVVASMMKADSIDYELKKLTDEDCMRVFTQHSLGTKDFSTHPHLKDIGDNLVKKCDGLPLAAKTIGGLLRGKYDLRYWKKVLNSQIWDLPGEENDIMRALKVSYHFLPANLKRCFTHCSLLPKDYEFDESEIVLLWMAEGLLPLDTSEKKMEEFGHDYFEELLSRSFFQKSSSDTTQFVMHDLINDLSRWAAGGIYFRMEDNQRPRFSKSLRHFSYIIGDYDGIKRFEGISDAKNLRTFLPVSGSYHFLSNNVVDMLLKLQRLKVLSLKGYQIYKIPDSIGDLEHLRHLDLSRTNIKILPESVSRLLNLNTLLLQDCRELKKLCTDMGNLIKLHHLDNYGVHKLKKMPLGIDKLTRLQTLSYFVVEKSIGSRIIQLKSLDNLHGVLKISRLENVLDAGDAKEAKLNGKQYLNELVLEWTSNSKEPEIEKQYFRVLDMLKPHENLKELTIKGYGGVEFPIWLGGSTFGNLVRLRFQSCGMCTSLPSVGQLPHLEHLYIVRMAGVKKVDPEFNGNTGTMSFPSLKTLYFGYMEEWKDWIPHASSRGVDVLPKLQELSLVRCSKLLGSLPERLPSLKRLVIKHCEQLEVLVPSISTICKFEISGCKKVVWRSAMDDNSLNSMVFNEMSYQVSLKGVIEKELPDLEEVGVNNSEATVQQLKIADCPKLVSLVGNEENGQQQQEFLCRLHYLKVGKCRSLVKLPQALFNISSLQKVKISGCAELVSFPETALPSQLREFSIERCNALESLPKEWMHSCHTSFEKLVINCCDSLTFIARVQLPPSLKRVEIKSCKKLRTLIDEENVNSLIERLEIRNCPSLTSLGSKSEFLKYLCLENVPKLESIVEILDNNTSLESLWIVDCPNIVSFPEGGLSSMKLTYLSIRDCEKLKSLPNNIHNLSSMQHLEITDCPSIESFPEDGLPTNLHSLEIFALKIFNPLFDWGLDRFASIKQLYIEGCPLEDETGMKLPNSLTHLTIQSFPNLERFSSSFKNLTSLESLVLRNCPKLQYFPEHGFPNSLFQLQIHNCTKLQYFPEHGFPGSLLVLEINGCPLIEGKCKMGGQYWPLIAHLPRVRINFRSVFDPSRQLE